MNLLLCTHIRQGIQMCHVHVRVCGAFVCGCTSTCTRTYTHAHIHMNEYTYILMYVYIYYKNLLPSYDSRSPSSPCGQKHTVFHAHFTLSQDIFPHKHTCLTTGIIRGSTYSSIVSILFSNALQIWIMYQIVTLFCDDARIT